MLVHIVGDACAWCEVKFVRVCQTFGKTLLSADEDGRHAINKSKIGVGVTNVAQRTHEFIAHAELNRGIARDLKTVLHESIRIPLTQLHLRNASLSLLHCR